MHYFGMPMGMWALFAGSFRRELTSVFGYDPVAAKKIARDAKLKYRAILRDVPEFEKGDRFKMNLVNCAMLGAFVLSMPKRPDVQRLTDYYAKSMMTPPMRFFCRKSAKKKFTEKNLAQMRFTEKLKAADRNPFPFTFFRYRKWKAFPLGQCMTPSGSIWKFSDRYGFSRYFLSLLSLSNIVNFIYFFMPCASQYR